jgi:hypothetical protein
MSNESYDISAQLERLPRQIERFYRAYFSELRSDWRSRTLSQKRSPITLRDISGAHLGGTDGIVVVHFPSNWRALCRIRLPARCCSNPSLLRATEDVYGFFGPSKFTVRELAEALSGEENIGLEISAGVPWGAIGFAAPQRKINATTGKFVWEAS